MQNNIEHKMQKTTFITKNLESDGIFFGYASVFNCIDLQNDELMPGAFNSSLKKWNEKKGMPKMLWQHDHTKPIGKWLEVFEDEIGLFAKGQLLTNTAWGSEAYKLLKNKIVDGLSIGFSLNKHKFSEKGHKQIEEVDLHEISLVTFAANPKAKILNVKNNNCHDELIHKINKLSKKLENLN